MKKITFLLKYFKYLLASVNQHGVHSPFVYKLITEVIYDKTRFSDYKVVENARKKLLKDSRVIEITDLGAGSLLKKSNKRKVKEIAASAAKPAKHGKLLYRLVKHFKPQKVLELGTSLGISTLYLALGNRESKVISIEGCPACAAIAKKNFSEAGAGNIELHVGNFDNVLPEILSREQVFDFIFIDGNHRKEPTLRYFKEFLSHIDNNSVMVFDDIHWSDEMEDAWTEIKKHPLVTVTVDLFFFGLVFFRKEQRKQDFIIRL